MSKKLAARVPLRRLAVGVPAALLLAGVGLGRLAERREPAAARRAPLVRVRLEPCSALEAWQPRGLALRPSAIRYGELEALLDRARALLHSGRIDRALLAHEEALQRFPAHPAAHAALGDYYLALRDRARLRRVLAVLESVEPDYPPLRLLQAEAALLDGAEEDARALLEPLQHAARPVRARARLLLAALALQRGDRALARRLARSIRAVELERPEAVSMFERLQAAVSGVPPLSPAD